MPRTVSVRSLSQRIYRSHLLQWFQGN
uniref:Uncharacterized protein n=1 Tax=Rhizophora mucronata TaxID=61149 RepID=A0A2P2M6W5_RHIMU